MPVPSLPDFGTMTRTTTSNAPILYAFLAAGREVFYVGQTTNPAERLRKHAYKPWWPDVAAFTWHTVDNWVDDLYERRPPRRLVGIA
jgi:hypothetical protein